MKLMPIAFSLVAAIAMSSCVETTYTYSRQDPLDEGIFTGGQKLRPKTGPGFSDGVLPDGSGSETEVLSLSEGEGWQQEGVIGTDKNLVSHQLGPVYFGYDSAAIPADAEATLNAMLDFLIQNPNYTLKLVGNCDERGSDSYNLALGERRAQSVKSALIQADESLSSRLKTHSFGEEKPAVQGSGEAVWSQNRRVEFLIYK